MIKQQAGRVLVFDIETAGVQGLRADRGFVVCFGYKWLSEGVPKCLTISEFPGNDPHDDTQLLKAISSILDLAEGFVAHFGEKFDKPYLQSRFLRAGVKPMSNNKLTDTCLLARAKLKLSSNRLGNLAEFLDVPTKKMEKRGGWPAWWLGALKGDKRSIQQMAAYCKQDVQCLEEVYLKLRHLIPTKYLPVNEAIAEESWTCAGCGGHRKNAHGFYFSEKRRWRRYQCQSCGRWDRAQKADANVPKV